MLDFMNFPRGHPKCEGSRRTTYSELSTYKIVLVNQREIVNEVVSSRVLILWHSQNYLNSITGV